MKKPLFYGQLVFSIGLGMVIGACVGMIEQDMIEQGMLMFDDGEAHFVSALLVEKTPVVNVGDDLTFEERDLFVMEAFCDNGGEERDGCRCFEKWGRLRLEQVRARLAKTSLAPTLAINE